MTTTLAQLRRTPRLEIQVAQLAALFQLGAGGSVTLDAVAFERDTEGLAPKPTRPMKLVAVVLERGPEGIIGIFEHGEGDDGEGLALQAKVASAPTTGPATPATTAPRATHLPGYDDHSMLAEVPSKDPLIG